MALTLRNSFPTGNGTDQARCDYPTGLQNLDSLLLEVVTAADLVPTVPGGFVLLPGALITGTTRTAIYQKIADGSEAGESFWVRCLGTTISVGIVAIDSSALTYAVVEQVATASSGSASATKTWASVTNVATATLLLCFGGFGTSAASTPNAGMTERWDTSNPRIYLQTQAVAGAGATGARTATGTSVATQRCITISVAESNTNPITYPAEEDVTALPLLVELTGAGAYLTQAITLAEISAIGLYLTAAPVLVEIGAVGINVTAAPLLVELEFQEPAPAMPTSFPTNAGTRRMHVALPEEVGGYAFDPEYSWWSTVVAEASTNLIVNPSFEAWNDIGNVTEFHGVGDIEEDWVEFPLVGATQGRRCARLTSGIDTGWLTYDQDLHLSAGAYSWSCDVYVTRAPYTITLHALDAISFDTLGRRVFNITQTGWQRLSISFVLLGTVDVELRLISLNTNPNDVVWYTDAWQLEPKRYPTTYLDGDMIGFSDSQPYQSYFWHGEPHRSRSSRLARTGSGGRVVSWGMESRFKTTSIVGLGVNPNEQQSQVLGDGREVHLGMLDKARDFTITGRIFAGNHRELRARRNDLIRLLKHNNTVGSDQMVLRFQEVDDHEQLVGAALDITCVYREGLQGNTTNLYQENLPLQFRALDPFLADIISSSAELLLYRELVDNGLIFRDEEGEYTNLGTALTTGGVVARVGFLRDGSIIAMGNFTHIGGHVIASAAMWDGSDWVALGTGAPSGTNDIDDGYKLGYPLTVADQGGDVWQWDDIAHLWDTVGSHGFTGSIETLQRDTNGDIWIGGIFEFAEDGTTKYNNVARYNAATEDWEQIGGGLADPYDINDDPLKVHAVLASNDGSVYFGGSFGDAFGNDDPFPPEVLAKGVARWDIATSTWNRVGTGLGGTVQHLLRGIDGYLYAVGNFATDAGLSPYDLRGFARFNGHAWEEVFPLVNQDGEYGADGVLQDNDGIFWFYNFVSDTAHDLFVVDGLGEVGFFGYRDGIFYPPYMDRAGMLHMAIGPGNRVMHSTHGYTLGDVQVVPALNRIDYAGSADAPLHIHIHGQGYLVHVLNHSTEGGIYGRGDFLLSANEEMLLRTDSQRTMVYSNQRRNLSTQISVGASNMKALRLRPGENRISVLVTQTNADSAYGWLGWRNRFVSLAEASL